jgi:hypothetical protein
MVEATPLLSPLPARLYAMNAGTEREVKMYSPKIEEKLIPALYRLAKALNVPMTRLVNAMIVKGIEQIERGKRDEHDASKSC